MSRFVKPPMEESPFQRTISKEQINHLPLRRYHGTIHLIYKDSQVEAAVNALKRESILGFDTETRPSFKKGQSYPTALVQFAGAKAAYLFQLRNLKTLDGLAALCSNPRIIKVGVALQDDIRKLRDSFVFEPAGFTELSALTQQLGIVNTGLRSLAAIIIGYRISKAQQTSNWSRRRLTSTQLVYAATDAWISREIYRRLLALNLAKKTA